MFFLNLKKVLCLSPHPDDSEIGIMGSVLKFKKTHFDMLCLTKGGENDKTNKFKRRLEVDRAWNFLNCRNVSVIHSKNNYINDKSESEWVSYLEKIIKSNKHDGILIPSKKDSNFEHRFVNGFGLALARFSQISIIEYQTFSTLDSWKPNFFVEIEENYEKKIKALKAFKSQKNKPYFKKINLNYFHNNFQCSKKGLKKIEKFKIKIFYL
jgi:LmbE family N-acetylglucosaminyl deacetylase